MKYITKERITQVIFIVFAILMISSILRNIGRVVAIRGEVAKEKSKLEKIQNENDRITEEIKKAQSPEFIEKQVRDKLGLAKEGEVLVVLPDADEVKKLAPRLDSEENYLPDPIWKKWWKLFM